MYLHAHKELTLIKRKLSKHQGIAHFNFPNENARKGETYFQDTRQLLFDSPKLPFFVYRYLGNLLSSNCTLTIPYFAIHFKLFGISETYFLTLILRGNLLSNASTKPASKESFNDTANSLFVAKNRNFLSIHQVSLETYFLTIFNSAKKFSSIKAVFLQQLANS